MLTAIEKKTTLLSSNSAEHVLIEQRKVQSQKVDLGSSTPLAKTPLPPNNNLGMISSQDSGTEHRAD